MKQERAKKLISSALHDNYVDFRKEVHTEFNERISTISKELKSEILNRMNGKQEKQPNEDE